MGRARCLHLFAKRSPPHPEKETNEDPAAASPRKMGAQKIFPINRSKSSRAVTSPLVRTAPLVTNPWRAEAFRLSAQHQVALSVLHLQQVLQGSCVTVWSHWEFQVLDASAYPASCNSSGAREIRPFPESLLPVTTR